MPAERPIHQKVRHVTVDEGHAGQRLDNFLAGMIVGAPRGLVYKIIRTGQVRLNGGRAKPSSRLAAGDEVRIPPVALSPATSRNVPAAALEAVKQAILEEDPDFLLLNKPAGMAVHAGSGIQWGLIDVIRELFDQSGIELVHRLDRETSGLLLLARNKQSMRWLQRQFRESKADKRYFCLLDTQLGQPQLVVDQPLLKKTRGGQRIVEVDPTGKTAATEFRLLEALPGCSYVEANLLTGRTHQIRAHAAFLGGALAGDPLYSTKQRLEYWQGLGLKRLFLHAHSLALETRKGCLRRFSSPLPVALDSVLKRLRDPSR
jgi:23S rRNA pseudouridine955/2504/2580 synthase